MEVLFAFVMPLLELLCGKLRGGSKRVKTESDREEQPLEPIGGFCGNRKSHYG